eukprot:scaffold71097_cov52-Phaeocystis_antarctica.AAC.1
MCGAPVVGVRGVLTVDQHSDTPQRLDHLVHMQRICHVTCPSVVTPCTQHALTRTMYSPNTYYEVLTTYLRLRGEAVVQPPL